MRLVKLTSKDKTPALLNPDKIIYIVGSKEYINHCNIRLEDSEGIIVQGSLEEVEKQIMEDK